MAKDCFDLYKELNAKHPNLKQQVKDHWNQEPCESRAGKGLEKNDLEYFEAIDRYRYSKSPFIYDFAKFESCKNKKVLEIGLGTGSDFIRWARNGAELYGIDLTEASVALCKKRLTLEKLSANVQVGDAENLPFNSSHFDLVYSYGVIHHSPNIDKILSEIYRVLKPGATAKIMIYHANGLAFKYEWILHALLKFKLNKPIREVAFYNTESLGTKIYSKNEARKLFGAFHHTVIKTIVDAGDLFDIQLSDKYQNNWFISNAQKLFSFLKYLKLFIPSTLGGTMLIEATK